MANFHFPPITISKNPLTLSKTLLGNFLLIFSLGFLSMNPVFGKNVLEESKSSITTNDENLVFASYGSYHFIDAESDVILSINSDPGAEAFALDDLGALQLFSIDAIVPAADVSLIKKVRFKTDDGEANWTEGVAPYVYKGDMSGDYIGYTPVLNSTVNFTVEYFDVTNLSGATPIHVDTFSITFVQSLGSSGGGAWSLNGDDIHYDTGNVGIGTTNPGSWKLAVNGNLRAKEVKVETGWADYVFSDDYKLPTLQEVEAHILENGHLINIPSAEDVAANGVLLGEINKLLLEKIEELTLYTIQQEKQLQSQADALELLKEQVRQLSLQLEH